MLFKGKEISPYESFYWNTTADFNRGEFGGGISRTVKTDNSLATMVKNTPKCYNSKVDGEQPSLQDRVYSTQAVSTACTTGFHPSIAEIKQVGNFLEDKGFSNPQVGRVYSPDGSSPTIDCMGGGGREPKILEPQYRIRKLTPREVFRLMDVSEKDIDTIQASGVSNTQQYKMAGNSIVVNVLYHIFRTMFVDTANPNKQLTIFDSFT